jgi:DNA-binding transcriptional ArsR family regulator
MDIQRDNQKDSNFSSIPYSPDLFHNDRDFYLAYKKLEHIVAAVFLVSGLIEQDVLMKDAIRGHSLQTLNRIVALIGKSGISVSDIQAVASHVLHLNSLLDIAFWSGQVSQMNLAILQKEITSTYQTLNDLSAKYKNTFYIGSNFFKSDKEILNDSGVSDTQKRESQAVKDIIDKRQSIRQENTIDKRHDIKDTVQAQPSESKEQRREAILSLLRQKSNLSVKDFIAVVPQYSEKTIQRELLALVEEGIIRKEGERRWSTYSLAT